VTENDVANRTKLRGAAALYALILAACGGGGGSTATAPATPTSPTTPTTPEVPGAYADTIAYSSAATASLATPNENAAVIASHIQLGGQQFNYTATTGHLTATDARTGKAAASFFYIAYTVPGADLARRPLIFFYNGGPGSASAFLHLGSFGPRRLVSTIPSASIAPVQLVDNQETLLAQADLVFVDAIGTGFSQAVAPSATADFGAFVQQARSFAAGDYRSAIAAYLTNKVAPPASVIAQLVNDTGMPTLTWQQNFDMGPGYYQANAVPGQLLGRYDARVSAPVGSALTVDGDPSLTVINAAFTSSIATYLAGELHYSARSGYVSFNDIVSRWNFSHDGRQLPDTLPDLAAAMALNPKLRVMAVNGYHDLATPFHQTELDLARLGANPLIVLKYYASGHMTYLDDTARRLQQSDLINFVNSVTVAQ
jgi:carboxypeptidase C (cathepsin A)